MIYTVTLNPALDYYLGVNEIKSDIQLAERAQLSYGGKGLNVSAVLKALGIESTALGFAGGFSGEKLRQLLSDDEICTDFVEIDGDTRINVKISGVKEITVNAPGPSITLQNEQALIKRLGKIKAGDYLVLCGSIPSSMGDSAYERIIGSIDMQGVSLVVDTTGNALLSTLKHKPLLIKPNNFELEDLAEKPLKSRDEIIEAARGLQKMGARNVLVSLGADGMLLLDENGDVNFESAISGEVKNTIGCGDSAVAGFIAGLIKKQGYRYALKLANACGSATAFSERLASKDEIEKLLLC